MVNQDDHSLSAEDIQKIFSSIETYQKKRFCALNLIETLNCLYNESRARIIFAIGLLKISTPYELKTILNIISRDKVVYDLTKAQNCGLVNLMTKNNQNYHTFLNTWQTLHRNTNKMPVIYIASDKLLALIDFFASQKKVIFSKRELTLMASRGKIFTKLYHKEKATTAKYEIEREKLAIETIGACTRCSKIITKTMVQNKLVEKIYDNLYCKSCIKEMKDNGELSELMRNNNINPK